MKKKPLLSPAATPAVPNPATKVPHGTPRYGDFGHPSAEAAPEPIPDHRAAGGNVFDLHNEQTTL